MMVNKHGMRGEGRGVVRDWLACFAKALLQESRPNEEAAVVYRLCFFGSVVTWFGSSCLRFFF